MPEKQARVFISAKLCSSSLPRIVAVLGCAAGLAACGSLGGSRLGTVPSTQVYSVGEKIPQGGGHYKVGNPYTIAGVRYYPKLDPNYDRRGVASWYGTDFHGRKTANGEIYDMNRFSAAHRTMPLPSYAKVTNLQNGRSVTVRVNDRGPYAHDREIDMSRRAAIALGFKRQGTTPVRVKYLGPAPLDGDGNRLVVANRHLGEHDPQYVAEAAQKPRRRLYRRRAHPVAEESTSKAVAASATGAVSARPGLYVQAASFSDPKLAAQMKGRLATIAPAEVAPANLGYGTFYRVRLGPMKTENEAYVALARVRAAGLNSARIISN